MNTHTLTAFYQRHKASVHGTFAVLLGVTSGLAMQQDLAYLMWKLPGSDTASPYNTYSSASSFHDGEATKSYAAIRNDHPHPQTIQAAFTKTHERVSLATTATSSAPTLRPAAPYSASSEAESSNLNAVSSIRIVPDIPASLPSSTSSIAATQDGILMHAVFPVSVVPNWGAMRTPQEWNRSFDQLERNDFVALPVYDLDELMTPVSKLQHNLQDETVQKILTSKLTYSTRHFGSYHLDSDEWTGVHPGIDIKLAKGTPVGSIGDGIVDSVQHSKRLGLHVVVRHELPANERYFSIYGHLGYVSVGTGDTVKAGMILGTVGMTGNTSSAHLHLQIDRDIGLQPHVPYMPTEMPSIAEARRYTVHPVRFIHAH